MYDSDVHEGARKVLRAIRKGALIAAGDRVAVAVSGGADSVGLLLVLLDVRAELGIVLSVAHVNHKLRGEESDGDAAFVADLAGRHGLELHVRELPLPNPPESGIEAAARQLRYDFFRHLMRDGLVTKVATGHTVDDQAETVLLRILRGAGLRGLSGIHPRLAVKDGGQVVGEVVRPLLGLHRSELEPYLRDQEWREDSSNRDPNFLRNRVRHGVLPQLKREFGAGAVDNLADLAEIARAEEEHWKSSHPEVLASENTVRPDSLLALSLAAQRRLIRNWLEQNAPGARVSFRLIEDILDLAAGLTGKRLGLPGGKVVRRTQNGLRLETSQIVSVRDYEYPLTVPGHVDVAEVGVRITAARVDSRSLPDCDRELWLDPKRLPNNLIVRNWRAGDQFWPAHTKEARKVKALLSDRHLTGVQKKLWPVIVAQGIGVVWMRGFPVPEALCPAAGTQEVVWIQENAMEG